MKTQGKPLILTLVKRAAIFLFAICAVSLFYWIIGSETSFLDETEALLIVLMRISSLSVLACSIIGLLLSLFFAVVGRYGLKVAGLLGYIMSAALGTASLFLAQAVSILSQGLR